MAKDESEYAQIIRYAKYPDKREQLGGMDGQQVLGALSPFSQEEYQQSESKSVLEKLYGNSLKKFVASLYQGKKMNQDDIKELHDFLEELEDKEEDL